MKANINLRARLYDLYELKTLYIRRGYKIPELLNEQYWAEHDRARARHPNMIFSNS